LRRPIVLITASVGTQVDEYAQAVAEAGGEPVRLDSAGAAGRALENAQGLLVSGGGDVGPSAYGAPNSPSIEDVDAERDALEIGLIRAARERRLPTLCICRGLQVANVAFGGTLLADIPAALGVAALPHQRKGGDGRNERGLIAEHVVRIDAGSALARIVGTTEVTTGARHHQAVERCAADLRVVARTADGIVEGLEANFVSPFWLAVQWHPESTRELDGGASRALFAAFTEAARLQAGHALNR